MTIPVFDLQTPTQATTQPTEWELTSGNESTKVTLLDAQGNTIKPGKPFRGVIADSKGGLLIGEVRAELSLHCYKSGWNVHNNEVKVLFRIYDDKGKRLKTTYYTNWLNSSQGLNSQYTIRTDRAIKL